MTCPKCGTQNYEGVKFCRECGTQLSSSAAPSTQSHAATSSTPSLEQAYKSVRDAVVSFGVSPSSVPEQMPSAANIRESLARLGISFSRGQLVGFGLSLLGGLIAARILPYIYPIFDPILTLVFGSGPGAARDGFNTNMMTLITFFTSFGMSFVTMLLTKEKNTMMHSALNNAQRHWLLTGTAFSAASISGLALLLHAAGWLPMYFLVDISAAPSLVLLLILGIVASRIDERVFLNRLVVGAWGGIVATLAYDGVRLLMRVTKLISFNPFQSHPAFGYLITGQPEETMTAILVGWAYHFWNGFGFAIMYTLIAGNLRWYYALGWAMFLEIAWLTALPSAIHLQLSPVVVAVSLVGHGFYGVVLGLIAQRFIRA